jgi:hypothetical protein
VCGGGGVVVRLRQSHHPQARAHAYPCCLYNRFFIAGGKDAVLEDDAGDDVTEPAQTMDAAVKALEDEGGGKSSQQLMVCGCMGWPGMGWVADRHDHSKRRRGSVDALSVLVRHLPVCCYTFGRSVCSFLQLDALLVTLPKCVSRDLIDKFASDFVYFNSKLGRLKLVRSMYQGQRSSVEMLPYLARLTAILEAAIKGFAKPLLEVCRLRGVFFRHVLPRGMCAIDRVVVLVLLQSAHPCRVPRELAHPVLKRGCAVACGT